MSALTFQALVRRVDLFTLKLFLAAIEEGQINRAALREHVVPSAATRRIQELEEIAGIKLLERSAKGVVPSPAGLVFARYSRIVLGAMDDLRREISKFTEGIGGHISIAAPRLLIVHFLAEELGAFTRRFPLVEVELREDINSQAIRALRAGQVDLAVFTHTAAADQPDLETFECHRDGTVAVVAIDHPLASLACVSLEQLLDHDIVGIGPTTTVMTHLHDAARQIGREPRVRYSVSTVEAARSLVGAGLGISLQPASMPITDQRERVTTVPVEGRWAERSYCVGRSRSRALPPAAQALIAQLTAAKQPGDGLPPSGDAPAP
jgi:DNA-binding transcriptional LysR family regulator